MGNYSELRRLIVEAAIKTESYLKESFAPTDSDTAEVTDAMKYSLLGGGKRIRPFLVLAVCKLFGGSDEAALPFAAALEMIHTFSLIHDDLPCMDDDDLRRGKPTCHICFGEATALLAGDALALKAFGVAASNKEVAPETALEAVRVLSQASAECGMVGGQIMDMYGESNKLSFEKLQKLQSMKTGALIRTSALLGALAAGKSSESIEATDAVAFADGIGLAFQIIDDLLDRFGDTDKLGKTVGSDEENSKTTFLTFMSPQEARDFAKKITEESVDIISKYSNSEPLTTLAYSLLERES